MHNVKNHIISWVAMVGLVSGTWVLVGCDESSSADNDGDSSNALTADDYEDVAVAVGALVVTKNGNGGELSAMADISLTVNGVGLENFQPNGEGALVGERGGIRYTYDVDCTQGGMPLDCGAAGVTGATARVDWDGSINLPRIDGTVSRDGTWSVAVVDGDTLAFDGSSDFNVTSTVSNLLKTRVHNWTLTYSADYEGIRINVPTLLPTTGTIRYQINAQRTSTRPSSDSEANFNVAAELRFNVNGQTLLVLDGTYTYELDLEDGTVHSD